MAECTNRVFPPTLPRDYAQKEKIAVDRYGQELYLVDGVAVYVLVDKEIKKIPYSFLLQLPGINKEAVQNADKAEIC